jgi:7-cyano-7-deazaguanine reductase
MGLMNNTIELNKIVGENLCKAGDGSAVNPYVTPDAVDKSLLVPVPRYLNREQYNLIEDALPFSGMDVWNAYEVSCLLHNGYPLSGIMKITYDCESYSIIESKSLKLYLNSYNMVPLGFRVVDAVNELEISIGNDLSDALDTPVLVKFFRNHVPHAWDDLKTISTQFKVIEDNVELADMTFTAYNEDPDILHVIDKTDDIKWVSSSLEKWTTNTLRSNCRVTNQPDWGDVFIAWDGPQTILPGSLLQYIASMRRENHFHEEICECIFKRLLDKMPNNKIAVTCLYTRRGGIDINPIRYNDVDLAQKCFAGIMTWDIINEKTERQ